MLYLCWPETAGGSKPRIGEAGFTAKNSKNAQGNGTTKNTKNTKSANQTELAPSQWGGGLPKHLRAKRGRILNRAAAVALERSLRSTNVLKVSCQRHFKIGLCEALTLSPCLAGARAKMVQLPKALDWNPSVRTGKDAECARDGSPSTAPLAARMTCAGGAVPAGG